MAAVSSVTNRFTGVGLWAGITGIGALSLAGIDVQPLMQLIGNHEYVGPVAKLGVSFVLIYHYFGGVRHVVWDKLPERFLYNDPVEKSSFALFGVAALAGAGLAFVSI
jgi:succinate dehydrogenase (ubiquinone) cytochrome b560 subunit